MASVSQAIVLSAGPNGLGAVRSLDKENIAVDVIAIDKNECVLNSRLPFRKAYLSKGLDKQELLSLLSAWPGQGQTLIPTSDWFVDFLVSHQKELSKKYKFVLPKDGLSTSFIDKKLEVNLVKSYVELPKTITELPDSPAKLLDLIDLPIIVKPRSNELNHIGQKNIQIYTKEQLEQFYNKFFEYKQYCIVQDIIVGGDENLWVCNCVFDLNSELINAFTFQRLQLTPPHYGVTCYAESLINQDVINQVKNLGKGLSYVGPAMVEFKLDDRDGKYKYIEVNPRLGLCNYFDTSCGKNNVYATYCVANGIEFKSSKQKNNRIFLSLYEDLYSRFRDEQSLIFVAKTYLKDLFKPHSFIYFTWRDPWPAFVVGSRQLKKLIAVMLKKIIRK